MKEDIWEQKCIFSPSLICFDLCNLESQIKQLKSSGIQMLHVDILDGYFSPSMPIGLDIVRQLRAKTDLDFDVHLMANSNEFFVKELMDIGVQQIIFHCETEPHIDMLLNKIREKGIRAGVALKPATPLSTLEYVLDKCDTVLLMLINPGYAGNAKEQQVDYAEQKIYKLRQMISQKMLNTKIEIDGRISLSNIKKYANKEVDIFVTGSTCIKSTDIMGSVHNLLQLRKAVMEG